MNRYWVATTTELIEQKRKIVSVEGIEVGLFYVEQQFVAWRNICPHAYAPVCEGRICGTRLPSAVYEYKYGRDQQILRCPWHGWEFDLLTGEHLVEGSVKLKAVPLEVEGEDIYLLLKNTKERAQNHV